MKQILRFACSWTLGERLREEPDEESDEDESFSEREIYIQVMDPIFDSIIPIQPGDQFYLIRKEFNFPLHVGLSLRQLIDQINNWLNEKIPKEKYDVVKEEIRYFSEFCHQELFEKLSTNQIAYKDLIGDHVFFGGNMIREDNFWHLDLGS